MSVIGVCSVKGAPGVTTLAVALAAHGQRVGAMLIEADAAGGDLAWKFGVSQSPGLVQFAARARHSAPGRDVLEGLTSRIASPSFDLVPAPVEPAAVTAALGALTSSPDVLAVAGRRRPVIIDMGRVGPHSLGLTLAEACDVLVLVVRGDTSSLGHAKEATWLTEVRGQVGFVLVDSGPYHADDAVGALPLPCFGTVPFDRRPLAGRRAAAALTAIWDHVTTTMSGPLAATEPVQVSTR